MDGVALGGFAADGVVTGLFGVVTGLFGGGRLWFGADGVVTGL